MNSFAPPKPSVVARAVLGGIARPRVSKLKMKVAMIIGLSLVSSFALQAQITQIGIQHTEPGTLKQASGTGHMHIPGALGFDHYNGSVVQRKIMMPWSTNADYTPASSDWAISSDGGVTFGATQTPNVPHRAMIKRRASGELLSFNFGWDSQTATTLNFTYHKSTNAGVSWSTHTAIVDFGAQALNSMHFHRNVLEENDGSLYAIGYANFNSANPPQWRIALIKSTNGGANWTYMNTIATSATLDFTEAAIERCADGSWIMVTKSNVRSTGANEVLRYRKSTNLGVTWLGTVDPLPGMTTAQGVDPVLKLMPNGVLVLSYGPDSATSGASRDLKLAFSTNHGASWTNVTTVHLSTLWTGQTITSTNYESSGYTDIPSIGAHRFLHLSDTGHSWSYNNTFPSPNPFSIRGRYVDVVRTNEINRIDLRTKLALVPGMVTTDLTYTDPTNQESRPSGAVDGSTQYWSGAFKSATTGSYTIDLQKTYKINRIGVCLKYNTAESATVEISTNGSTWTNVKTYTNAIHRALDYFAVTPTDARYVRVNITGGTSPVSLNEIELYSTTDTFENNAVGIPANPHGVVPPGYVVNGTSATQYGFAVRDITTSAAGFESERSYQMWDGSSTWRAGIKKTVAATAGKSFEFRIKPLAYDTTIPDTGCIQFMLLTGTGTSVFQMAVFPDGGIKYYNGSTWVATTGTGSPAGANTVPLNTWSTIKVVATLPGTTAQITVNGVVKGNAGKLGTPTTMNGFAFGSGGTAPTGDNALLDDISIN